jgi:hypothetical protein
MIMQLLRRAFFGALGLFALLATGGYAHAQGSDPLRTFSAQLGPYPVVVEYYNAPSGGQALSFRVVPKNRAAAPSSYTVTAVPDTTLDATPVKATLAPDMDASGAVRGTVNLPVSGQWLLLIDADGPLGRGGGNAPVLASAPPAIPLWLGWLIGLTPVWAILVIVASRAPRRAKQIAYS